MRARAFIAGLIGIIGLIVGVVPPDPAAGAGLGDVQFSVEGVLKKFPCPDGCAGEDEATFEGTGTGTGNITAVIGGVPHNATFTILSGSVSGSAEYTEPEDPVCPAIGTATGTVTLSRGNGITSGVIARTSPLIPTGTIFDVSVTLGFSYQRVGLTPVIDITGGSVTIQYFIPGTGQGSVTEEIARGSAAGVFDVEPGDVTARCSNPGELRFRIRGDAVVMTS